MFNLNCSCFVKRSICFSGSQQVLDNPEKCLCQEHLETAAKVNYPICNLVCCNARRACSSISLLCFARRSCASLALFLPMSLPISRLNYSSQISSRLRTSSNHPVSQIRKNKSLASHAKHDVLFANVIMRIS